MSHSLAFRLSRGIENTSRPPIPQAYQWAATYVPTLARPLLDMSQGAPGVPPPRVVLEALGQVSSDPLSCGYLPNEGELSLRQAVVDEMKHVYGEDIDVSPENIAITTGCNLAFVAVAMTIADAGDEMILPIPWYFNHEMTLTMLNMKAVVLPTNSEDGFLPSPELCETLITPRTKAIILVSPNNPTGAVYPPELLGMFARLAHKHQVALIIDETYRDFVTTGAPHTLFANSISGWNWRTTLIHLYSFSKAYCIPGHRLGLIAASSEFIPYVSTTLDSIQICAPRPPQRALAPLLSLLRPFVRESALTVAQRHAIFRECLPIRWVVGSQGGYYSFVKHPFVRMSAYDVCKRLTQELGILCLPATFFNPKEQAENKDEPERWIRFSVANVDDEKVRLVCERLKESEDKFGWEVGS